MIDTPTDPRTTSPHRAPHGSQRDDEHQRYNIPALERRMRFWELANGALCALFLWTPMAAAAFPRAA